MKRSLSMALALACIAFSAEGHEFWIDPVEHQVAPGANIVADLRVGQEYGGSAYSYLPPRFRRFDYAFDGQVAPVEGLIGDRPAVTMAAPGEGLVTLIHVTTDSRITWDDFADFEAFVVHKDAEWTLEPHESGELSKEKVSEVYSRYAKSLVGVGKSAGSDIEAGLLTEIVALENPYTDDTSDGVDVRLLYQGEPRGDEQIEIYQKTPEGEVTVSTVRTDDDGVASIPVTPGNRYMLDAVVLRRAEGPEIWESLWANLTFAVPAE
ncbi:DUF4198 domain-containing protein [Alphaproteobacteria bacterium GH1-50]|uniref:DUF4198 domain-containing protein n=1 Tax=Kangsaoukella pontilimi TaxID=2691042 RepID=A0A7C9IT55_9RHOB|nr:DUF4198 domain-containing protein [Kangsaoukella pontilimi]MXQ09326.1 DUF4198 domain-containing protein [Kangsaoukella pontilimi]